MCKLERYEEAVEDYSYAISLDRYYELAYLHRGLTYFVLKQYEKARKDFIKTLEINPANKDAKDKLDEIKDYVVE